MVKTCFFLLLLALTRPAAHAQFFHDSLIVNDVTTFEEAHQWHRFDPIKYTVDTTYAKVIPSVDMETIQDRASCLDLDMPLTINKTVCGFIHFFTVRKRNYTQTMLERKNYYFPIFEFYLKKHGMPDALKYLSIVESGLNFKAKSKTGALGLWQFMPGTGSDFYLKQNQHIDERQNPYLATEAACKFLKYLHRLYGDWELALAAYNCGPGNVNKAIKRSGRRGFWEIYDFLPKETRSYVPQFHAVVYSMNFAADHNIHPDLDSMMVTTALDTFRISKSFDIGKLERYLGMAENTLHQCNPTLRSHVYPAYNNHPLLVPSSFSAPLQTNLDLWIDSAAVVLEEKPAPHAKPGTKVTFYAAAKGEKLQSIAAKYNVATASLKKWNRLEHNKITKARRLKIYTPITETPVADPAATAGVKPEAETTATATNNPDYHIVKKGEKLYQIAMQYGRTTAELKRANQLTSARIAAGQKLLVNTDNSLVLNQATAGQPLEKPTTYTVSKGDRLFAIAQKNQLSVEQLRKWNSLKTDQVKPGQILYLTSAQPLDEASASTIIADSCLAEAQPQPDEVVALHTPKSQKTKARKLAATQHNLVAPSKTYLVQKGDTLYSITRKFARLTVKDLMRINKLKDKKIRPGQQLIIS